MPKIFISHSSVNNAAALAVANWLADSGWGEYFLDITPSRGLAPGERWQEALKSAADRCEAVLFLISPAWLNSRWCLAEFLLAKQIGKAIFGVLVETTPLDALPREMTMEWQLCDLVTGNAKRSFRVSQEPIVPATEVLFGEDGLLRLRIGLQRAGLDPASFPWPPHSDPTRAPYRGLNALAPEDAAVFFGREAAIVRGLDALRGSRERGVERLIIILGASGAGKSSFLRAGLWPRLSRDDRNFLPLPVIRPERAAISGNTGLAASIEVAFRERKVAKSRAEINNALREPDGFSRLLTELQTLAASRIGPDASSPTIIIPIDQGEEFFGAEGKEESERLLDLMALVLSSPQGDGAEALASRHRALAIVAIRSDSYERLQTEPRVAQVARCLFDLPPIARAEFKAVVEGPAKRHTEAGHNLTVDPALTEGLVNDAEGADSLPLLAFTLERLFVEYSGSGKLLLANYEAMGGVRGSIEAGIKAAFTEPGREPAVPADNTARERLLRAAFIPWLARVDPDTEERKRRVARWEEIPVEARSLIERLIEWRLLVRDRRKIEGQAEEVVVVEVAHEALLRQWPTLTKWLDEDADALKILDAVRRAATEWAKNRGETNGEAWLVHTGERLSAAEAVRRRSDFDALLGPDGQAYVNACRVRDERVRQEKEKTVRRTRISAYSILLILAVGVVASFFAWRQSIFAQKERNWRLATDARGQTDRGFVTLGTLLALEVISEENGSDHPSAAAAEAALLNAALKQREKRILKDHTESVNQIQFSPSGTLAATASEDGTARIWDTSTGTPRGILSGHEAQIHSAEFSRDGTRVITASADKTAWIWDVKTAKFIVALKGHKERVNYATFSPDGKRAITASADKTARVWDTDTGAIVATLTGHDKEVNYVAFAPKNGKQVISASADNTARVWDAETGRERAVLKGHQKQILHATFSSDELRIITASEDGTARLWEANTGEMIAVLSGHTGLINRASFSNDGKLIVTASEDGTARLWNGLKGDRVAVLIGHKGQLYDAQFSPDGRLLVTTGDDRTARIWDVATHSVAAILRGHSARVWSAVFSPDGHYVGTASVDKTARIWKADTGRVLRGHEKRVLRAIFSPDGYRVVTISDDHTARVWSTDTASEVTVLAGHNKEIYYAAYSKNSQYLVTTSTDGTAIVWDTASNRVLHILRDHKLMVNHAHFSFDSRYLVTAGEDGSAIVWEVASGKSVAVLRDHKGPVYFAEFSHDGRRVVTASQDGTARLWNANTGKMIAALEGHTGPVINGAFSPDDKRLVTASHDKTARVWDGFTGKLLSPLKGHADVVLFATFSPDSRLVVTASQDNTARIWDAVTGEQRMVLLGHDGEVNEASFSSNGRLILTSSNDGTARLWHAKSGLEVTAFGDHHGPIATAAFDAAGHRVVTASHDHTARLWQLPVGYKDNWIKYARETVPRKSLTAEERRLYLNRP